MYQNVNYFKASKQSQQIIDPLCMIYCIMSLVLIVTLPEGMDSFSKSKIRGKERKT